MTDTEYYESIWILILKILIPMKDVLIATGKLIVQYI